MTEGKPRYEPLPTAARARDLETVKSILASGRYTQHDLDMGLAHAAWYGGDAPDVLAVRKQIFDLLLARGANPNAQYGGNYGPLVFGCGECVTPEGLKWLLDAGADVSFPPVDTKYGMQCALSYGLGTYARGPGLNERRHRVIDLLLAAGAYVPPEVTPPILALHRGDVEGLRAMLDADPSLATRTFPDMPYGNTPLLGGTLLHAAAEFAETGCAELLLRAGADVHARSAGGHTPLHHAATSGSVETVELLFRHGARNWITDNDGKLALDLARERGFGEKDKVIALLSEVRILDADFRAAVSAIDTGDIAELKRLLQRRPELVRVRAEEEGWYAGPYFRHPTLLHFVAQNPYRGPRKLPVNICEIAQVIIDAGADVNARTESDNGGTALGLVASGDAARKQGLQIPLIELLVRNGADPAEALEAALSHQETQAAEAALRLGARPTLKSAAAMGDLAALKRLLAESPSEHDRLAAAQLAATHGRIDTLDALLASGLDINARLPHPYGPTLLHQAAWYGHRELVEHLLQRGADPNIRDTQFHGTPAGWAQHNGHGELAELLRQVERRIEAERT